MRLSPRPPVTLPSVGLDSNIRSRSITPSRHISISLLSPSTMKAALILALTSAVVADTLEADTKVVDVWGQCGGKDYNGDKACGSGNYCKVINEWYSQCQPGGNGQVGVWGQCGGKDYKGATQCTSGNECKAWNEWYSQCIPGSATTAPVSGARTSRRLSTGSKSTASATPNGISSYEACIAEASKRGKLYATWKDNTCTVLQTVYTYTLDKACKGAAKYNLDKWQCSGNHDFWGNDVGQAQTRFDRCLDSCENFKDGDKKCNAATWVRNPGSEYGVCFFKSFDDRNKRPSINDLGAIACNRLASSQ
ncbi:hypothetical protein SPRG_12308 [Saprolegnia parasitica CBS 223.65]|uniref:CBM1 domain-containing protein n=1 Tax=Saprolegnia parasitica (strain CBS 223.65) TaxID=695850 RepID=A0A067BUQ9_SAPPC|nr:hypothetical protein SPRG_12308 [Saprolegnia parasitica CBS 223.65]KDO22224.1 hypothetical protein SPRG_12308 [Saprolegnia parasitica CBS 223.65]|eukprot:XP_012207062.1 hypothetical protein SPRG_12308 [Saprolegnia parasitica CBS 223.65]